MARYVVEFKAFKNGEWYVKTETDYINSAYSVARVQSQGRAYRIVDTSTDMIIEEDIGCDDMYQ